MVATLSFLDRLAPTDLPVLLEGESGTGKEVVARAVHMRSPRCRKPFIPVNCGAIPGELQESELFGHARGAYTGAVVDRPGLFEAAHQGTLLLDEVGEMDACAQVKLLRVLESGEVRRLGENRTRKVDVRIIAATNADVDRAVEEGRFRRDLLFRLGAVRVLLPPLRERPADILPLAFHFLRKASVQTPALSPAAQMALLNHAWPGNVRELKFAMERAVALWRHGTQSELGEELLMLGCQRVSAGLAVRASGGGHGSGGREACQAPSPGDWPREIPGGHSLDSFLTEIERDLIAHALEQSAGNRTLAARLLGGLSRTTLIGKMKRLGLFRPAGSPG